MKPRNLDIRDVSENIFRQFVHLRASIDPEVIKMLLTTYLSSTLPGNPWLLKDPCIFTPNDENGLEGHEIL